MSPEISAVKNPFPLCLDQKPIGIDSRMVHQVGSEGEVSDNKWMPSLEVAKVVSMQFLVDKHPGGIDQLFSQFSYIHRHVGIKSINKAEVVLMRMTDNHGIRLEC